MDTIFTLGDINDEQIKLNLDELYERKQQHDLNTLSTYNKILSRIHNKIKVLSRQHINDQHCWYTIPEMIIGVPKYDHGACTAYIIDKLKDNGFVVHYTHPNLLFISWKNWVPSYVRAEIKKKTGVVIDGYGNRVEKTEDKNSSEDMNDLMFNKGGNLAIENKNSKEYKAIDSYKPSGLIYNESLLRKIEDKTLPFGKR
uniref:Uncharacterized protein n=1 Tax=viral metagenome TaxID=1070528 RepID=A0A6C0IHV3_9ZZZZ